MTAPCTVRSLTRDDAVAWAALRREALESHPLVYGSSVPDDPVELVDVMLERLASPASVVLGAFDEATLVGIIGVRRNSGRKEQHKAFIWGLYVTPAARGGGAGALLLRRAVEQARSWTGIEQVQLSVSDAAATARRLYDRQGFLAWGREPRALCLDGECADETYMQLDLRDMRGGEA
jgi:GNAT superfamily N-acetyltransferase